MVLRISDFPMVRIMFSVRIGKEKLPYGTGVAYALFGKQAFPTRLAGTAVKAEHLVREGSDEGWVELEFEHRGETYSVKRTCPRDRPSLTCNGKEIGSSAATVKEALYELIGVDDELFANVFYSEQDELRKVLEIKPEERKVFIETILGFEYLKDLKMSANMHLIRCRNGLTASQAEI